VLDPPVLEPIQQSEKSFILDWSDIVFHPEANITFYWVYSWLEDPQHSRGDWFPEGSALNISLDTFRVNGLYSFAVRAVETDWNESVRIESPWSNVEQVSLMVEIPPGPNYAWQGSYWEQKLINPGLKKTIIYTHHRWFWDTYTQAWKTVDFRDRGTHYLARNALVGIRFRNAYSEFFTVTENITRVGAERWRVQGLQGDSWVDLTFQNSQRSFLYTQDWVNLTRTQELFLNTLQVGVLNTTLSLGAGVSKYTVQVFPLRSGTIRLMWEFNNIGANRIKYLQHPQDIPDDLISTARKFTFYNGSTFALQVHWLDVNISLFQYCRVFKQDNQIYARAFFGNWTLEAGTPISLDPDVTTIKPPSEDLYLSHDSSPCEGACTRTISMMKFDISSLSGALLSATLSYYVNYGSPITNFNGNANVSRINNQTWTESTPKGEVYNRFYDNRTHFLNVTGITAGYPISILNTLDITDLITQDWGSSNFTIGFEDPDNPMYDSATDEQLTVFDTTILAFGCTDSLDVGLIDSSEASAFYRPSLEVLTEAPGPESETGIEVSLSIQPGIRVPTETHNIFFRIYSATTMYMQSGTWKAAETNDATRASFFVANSYGNFPCSVNFLYRDIGYPEALNTLVYETEMAASEGGITNHRLYVGLRDGSYDTVYDVGTTLSTSGSFSLDADNWHQGEVWGYHTFKPGGSARSYDVWFDQMYITFNALTETRTLKRLRNGTQVLETLTWNNLQDDTTLNITSIPTSYSLQSISPNCSYTDSISGGGVLTLNNVTKGAFEIIFDTGSTVHKMHFAHSYPDGLGSWATWDEVRWFLNNTQVEHQDYLIFSGTYDLEIFDYFSQLIKTDSISLTSTDAYLQRYEIELPIYLFGIQNLDEVAYNLTFSTGGVTGAKTVVPAAGLGFVRLYGTASGITYTATVFNLATGQTQDTFTIDQFTDPDAKKLNYYPGDLWDEVKESPGGGFNYIVYQVRQNWPDFLILGIILGVALISFFKKSEKSPKPKRRKLTDSHRTKGNKLRNK